MGRVYITASGNQQGFVGRLSKVLIQVNSALTGNIVVSDSDGTTSATIATITNPTVGSSYEYWDFIRGVYVNPSATCDITVNFKDRLNA